MHFRLSYLISGLALFSSGTADTQRSVPRVLQRDVAIIGGGSSGVYTAFGLRDAKKSVIVIEKQDRLGGHANTYTAPNGYTLDYGVQVFGNTSIVRDYFARFKIPLAALPQGNPTYQYFDFNKGKNVTFTPPSQQRVAAAFEKYGVQLKKYPSLQSGFNMTYPVDPDLLLPFEEFLQKYDCTDLIQAVFPIVQGYSPLLRISTLYMLKYLNDVLVFKSLRYGFLTTKNHDIQALYDAALKDLGQDALLQTSVTRIERDGNGRNTIYAKTSKGNVIIKAKKIVLAVQPLDINFKGLVPAEEDLFEQFFANGYYSAILSDTSVPPTISVRAAAQNRAFHIPAGPGVYTVNTNAQTNLTQVYYGSVVPEPAESVKYNIVEAMHRLQKANGYKATVPRVVAFADHSPFNSMVSNNAIKAGFYKKLFALQGRRDTFYNGAAFDVQDSTYLWKFTKDYILPLILGSLED